MEFKLRKLEEKDVHGMLEWMHEKEVNQYFRFDAHSMNEVTAKKFIEKSFSEENRNYAVADESDEYLGTISLKNINCVDENAEYAISLRKCARGKGVAKVATNKVLEIAFGELGLHKVYLNVLSNNIRAIKFYEKIGFRYIGETKDHVKIRGEFCDLKWFEIMKEEYYGKSI